MVRLMDRWIDRWMDGWMDQNCSIKVTFSVEHLSCTCAYGLCPEDVWRSAGELCSFFSSIVGEESDNKFSSVLY
jgi:hypothetical protein